MKSYIARVAVLAALYLLFGWLGVILKPEISGGIDIQRGAGVGLAVLLIFGRSLWPGIFIGAFLARVLLHDSFDGSEHGWMLLITDLITAAAATTQAVLGVTVIKKAFGFPIRFHALPDIIGCVLFAGPFLCLLTPTIGLGSMVLTGLAPTEIVPSNWFVWWAGDVIGVLVAVPLLLLWPSRDRQATVIWKSRVVPNFSAAPLAYIILSLVVTSTTWQLINRLTADHNRGQFERLVEDSAQALLYRVQSYRLALDAAKGLINASDSVSLAEWRTFSEALDLSTNLPGLDGVGFIQPVHRADLGFFLKEAQVDGIPDLTITPQTDGEELFIVKYIEPEAANSGSVGMNIAAEKSRREAAIDARDSGEPTLTRLVMLDKNGEEKPGFLLLAPLYHKLMPTTTVAERRAAFLGWSYAPFASANLRKQTPQSHSSNLRLAIYGSATPGPANLAYSDPGFYDSFVPRFHTTRSVPIFGQTWTIAWESTPEFEQGQSRAGGLATLLTGLAFTLVLSVFLLSRSMREQSIRETVAIRTRELSAQVNENRSIIETSIANIALLDRDGIILSVNEAVTRLFGYSRSELIGRSLSWLLGGNLDDYFNRAAEMDDTTSFRGEVEATGRDGRKLVMDVQVNAWISEDGQRHYTAVMNNVTEKKRMEEQLRMTQHRLEVALTGANIGVFDVNLRTGETIVSGTWKTLLGFPKDAEVDATREWRQRVHPDDLPMVEKADEACISGRALHSCSEYRIRMADGSMRWMRSDAVAEERDGNGIAQRLIGVQTDITELVQSKEDLRTSEEQFRTAIEYAPVAMAILDLKGRFKKVNAALGSFIGYSVEEFMDKGFLRLTHPDDRGLTIRQVERLLEGAAKSFQADIRYIRSDQTEVWGGLNVAIIRDSQGKAIDFIVQIQDLTEQKKLDRIKTEFVSTVSHELRTPLTSINGSLGLVLNTVAGEIPEKARRMLGIAQNNCNRLILLVNDILDMEKIAAGKSNFSFEVADVPALVHQAVAVNKPFADKYGVSFDLSPSLGCMRCRVDVNRFQQVMSNLLSNAAKFSPASGQVRIGVERIGLMVKISVSDDGHGIPAEFRDKIFKPFSQVDSSSTRAREGTGLGLNISRQIVERMGGVIGFDSETGKGTTFWITLPFVDTAEAGEAAPAIAAKGGATARKPRILHIEDDIDFAEVVAESFGELAELIHTDRVENAKQLIATQDYDLILMDWELPDGNGASLIEAIVAARPDTPIIALTAGDRDENDPNVLCTIIKTRTAFQEIVDICMQSVSGPRATFGEV